MLRAPCAALASVLVFGGCDCLGGPAGSGIRVEPHLSGSFSIERNVPAHASVYVGDCDGDGRPDTLVNDQGGFFALLEREGGPPERRELSIRGASRSVLVDDLDGDGFADLVVVANGVTLFRGTGPCQFADGVELGPPLPAEASQTFVTDLNQDGLADLVVGVRFLSGRSHRVFLGLGDLRFEERALPPQARGRNPFGPGFNIFSTFLDDVDGDGFPDLFAITDQRVPWFSWAVPGPEPAFRRDDQITLALEYTSPMAVSPLDFDRDGRMDYFVSGMAGSTTLLWNAAARRLRDVAPEAGLTDGSGFADWGAYTFDANLDGWPDVLVARNGVVENGFKSQPMALFVNRQDATMVDLGPPHVGVSLHEETLACADFDLRGRPSCWAVDVDGTLLLRNRLQGNEGWVGVRLLGRVSSPAATGARVRLDGEDRPLVVAYGGQAPSYRNHDPAVILATGARDAANVTVEWPSGIVQHVEGLATRRYHRIVEPLVLAVSRRTASADGVGTIEVEVDLAAAHASTATIESDGPGRWSGPPRLEDNRVRRTFVAPSSPGVARIVVALDGVALKVRPRLLFVAP